MPPSLKRGAGVLIAVFWAVHFGIMWLRNQLRQSGQDFDALVELVRGLPGDRFVIRTNDDGAVDWKLVAWGIALLDSVLQA